MVRAWDFPDRIDKRMEIRPLHIAEAKVAKQKGFILLGGATLSEKEVMNGSILLFEAENEKQVEDYIINDPYTKSKVWERWEIVRFNPAKV
jgi:uncharacterized protein YciI